MRNALRHSWIALLTGVLAVAASLAYSLNAPDRFQSRGTYVIGPAADLTQPETIVRSFDSLQGQGIVPTLVELLSSESIALGVAERVGLDARALERYDVRASVLSNSNTLELAVTGPSREATAALAEGIGTQAAAVFEELYSVYQIRELDRPAVPEERFSPQPARNAVLALLLGLTIGAAVIVYRLREVEPRDAAGRPDRIGIDLTPPDTGALAQRRDPVPPTASAHPAQPAPGPAAAGAAGSSAAGASTATPAGSGAGEAIDSGFLGPDGTGEAPPPQGDDPAAASGVGLPPVDPPPSSRVPPRRAGPA